jgi:hypothetical protein
VLVDLRAPGLTSLQEAALDVGEAELRFAACGADVRVPMPLAVEPEGARAKYRRRERVVRVSLPVRRGGGARSTKQE